MRIAMLIVLSLSTWDGGVALGQSAPAASDGADDPARRETPEEVVVRGRRLTELRFDVEVARERAYGIFNEINSDNDFDVYCRDERRYHSRATRRVCRARFEDRISSSATTEYLAGLFSACPGGGGVTQACMFSGYAAAALGAARGVEGQLQGRREQMKDEILRLAHENDRFAQAILDWYEANQQLEAARARRRD